MKEILTPEEFIMSLNHYKEFIIKYKFVALIKKRERDFNNILSSKYLSINKISNQHV